MVSFQVEFGPRRPNMILVGFESCKLGPLGYPETEGFVPANLKSTNVIDLNFIYHGATCAWRGYPFVLPWQPSAPWGSTFYIGSFCMFLYV